MGDKKQKKIPANKGRRQKTYSDEPGKTNKLDPKNKKQKRKKK